MKTTQITSALLISGVLALAFLPNVSADEDYQDDSSKNMYKHARMEMNNEHKSQKMKMREDYKSEKKEHKGDMKDHREKMKAELQPYFDALSSDVQEKLTEFMEQKMSEHEAMYEDKKAQKKEHMDVMREQVKNMSEDEKKTYMSEHKSEMQEKMEEMKKQMEMKRQEHITAIKEIVGDSVEGKAYISKMEELHARMSENRMETHDKMKEKRMDYKGEKKEMRSEFKNQRSELRSKYKKSFATKLENRLDSISETKLEKILIVIDNKIGEVEVNTKLSEIQKERILSQLEALKEIINEKLSMLEDAIDIDSIIK